MVAALALVAGVMLVMVVGSVMLVTLGLARLLPTLVPLAPGLVALGTLLLVISEILLLFGSKDDRRVAVRDFSYLVPTFLASAALYYVAQRYLW